MIVTDSKKYQLMKHQEKIVDLYQRSSCVFNTSEAGTGKTLAVLHFWAERRRQGGGRLLIFAPKSCVESVWANEVEKFFGYEFRVGLALAPKREPGFHLAYDVTVMNHDGIKWLVDHLDLIKDYDTLVWDESDALRHNSARTKAALKLAKLPQWKSKSCLTATPFNKSVTEMFYQVLFLDGGQRLGKSFYKFRSTVCDPIQVGPAAQHIQWVDKPDAPAAVAGILQDISIRFKLDEVVEMPGLTHRTIKVKLPNKLMQRYQQLRQDAILKLKSSEVVALNAAVLTNKLQQVASGSVYTSKGHEIIDTTKYELAVELAREARPAVVFYQYEHQLEALLKEAKKHGLVHQYIDGSVSSAKRQHIVQTFQTGMVDCVFLQINSAAHGITLHQASRVIFVTPPYSPSLYAQAYGRIYRTGQKHKCESILLVSKGTLEEKIVQVLTSRGEKQKDLLELLE